MNLPNNIKPKTGFWKILPKILSTNTAQAVYPNIYLPEKIYFNLRSKHPNPKWVGVLIHEQTHIQRQKLLNPICWNYKYLFSSKFRLLEEIEANKNQFRYLKGKGVTFDIKKRSRWLSGWLYIWPDSYENIKSKLEKIWGNL